MSSNNFVLSLPTLEQALDITPSLGNASQHKFHVEHLINGHRYTRHRTVSSNTRYEIVFDFGAAKYSADHLIIGRMDLLEDESVTDVKLFHSDENVIYKLAGTLTLNSSNFKGRFSHDQWTSFTKVSNKRFWKVQYNASSSGRFNHSKLYFGELFNFGIEPSIVSLGVNENVDYFIGDNGEKHIRKVNDSHARYNLTFQGVTDALVTSFETKAGHKINGEIVGLGAFLVTQTTHDILNNYELLHVNITDFGYEKRASDYNKVFLTCEELIG